MSNTEEDLPPEPPTAERVAARALVLSAISCRGSIEKDAHKSGAEDLRKQVVAWLDSLGLFEEVETVELELLSTPLGQLESKKAKDAGWKSEGLVVLAWALGCTNLPPGHDQCDPPAIADTLGFLCERSETPLENPSLRSSEEIEKWADVYLTLHWRLRQQLHHPGPMDFVKFVSDCQWAALRLDSLEIVDKDLAINGIPMNKVDHQIFRGCLSITQERHQAFNWLLGFERLYSQVTTDT